MSEADFWHENEAFVRLKSDRAVVKLHSRDGTFKASVVMPTEYYPLVPGSVPYEVFTYKNTEPVKDAEVLRIFDSVKYSRGFCYTNTKKLVAKLKAAGYDAKSYCGWLFTAEEEIPVHHCWCILDGKSVLDLADDFTLMLAGQNGTHFERAKDKQEVRELMVSFAMAAQNISNSVRCQTVGTPTPFLLYVGTECDADKAREVYNDLMRKYPDHECQRNCDREGLNATQRILKEQGLMG